MMASCGADAGTTDDHVEVAGSPGLVLLEVGQQEGEIDGGGRGTGEPGTAFIGDHSDDFAPGRHGVFAKTLAEGGGG